MTLFYLYAALLVALCLLWLLVGLFKNQGDSLDQEAVNITLARDRGETLAAALADGSIDQATYDYEREQLDYDLAADLSVTSKSAPKRGGHIVAAVLVALFVPIAAGTLYLELGNPDGITADKAQRAAITENSNTQANTQANANAQSPGPLAALLPKLEERLAAAPDDIQGWRLLARSYISIREYSQAQNAFEKALALDESDVATMTQLAESITMGRNGELAGEPMTLLDRANALDPMHEHTLWLRSIGKQQAGDHQEALLGFNLLMGLAKDNPDAIATVDQMRSRSIQALGANSVRQTTGDNSQASEPVTGIAGPAIEVSVSLDSTATKGAAAEYAVFIYATATNGPPMPLAVTRLSVKDLPATVVLDDSMAMIPNMKLSSFPEVTIGARVSASGNPIAQSGDWFTEATNVTVSDTPTISLTIDKQTP
jgi:cytochrome c-type biogenesis protein CcmH